MKLNKWILGVFAVCALASCDKGDDLPETTLEDKVFLTKVAYADNGEIEAGEIAFNKASLRGVKDFAGIMVTDHNKMKGDLKDLAKDLGIRTLPDMPDDLHLEREVVLNSTGVTGVTFDSTYMSFQQMDHQSSIDLFQNEINNGSDLRVKEFATKHLPTIQMHKAMADSLVQALHL